jgi:hypothetical protein
MMRKATFLFLAIGLAMAGRVTAASPEVQPLLDAGQFAQARTLLQEHLNAQPDDQDARLALGVTTFLHGIEEFAQTMYTFGLRDMREFGMAVPMLRVPVRRHPDPATVSADDVVAMFERFEEALAEVDTILEPIGDAPAAMPLRIGTVHMDLNGDGELTEDEGLWRFYTALTQPRWQRQADAADEVPEWADEFVLGLDTADAYWLRGYCHVMSALTDVVLAYDGTELFNRTGHRFFTKVDSPYPWLAETVDTDNPFDVHMILDLVAAFHLINQPLRDADRMRQARVHLKQVIALSRSNWDAILAETDNQNEWVPGPDQQGAIGVNLTAEQVAAWKDFLDEAEAILDGEKLIPFWRGTNPERGVNVRRIFEEPTRLDLILWLQGSAAAPYLEEGEVTEGEFWRDLNQQFGRNFPGFAFWIN